MLIQSRKTWRIKINRALVASCHFPHSSVPCFAACRSSNRLLFHMLSTTLPVGILAAVEEQCSVIFSRLNQEKDYIILIAAALFDHIFSADDSIRLSATNIFLYLLKERRTCILPLISYPDPSNTASSAPPRVLFPAASSSAPLFSPPIGSTDAQLAEWVVGMAPDVEHLRDSSTLRALVADNARKLRQQVTLGWQKRLMEGSRERYRTRLARLRKRSVGNRPRTHSQLDGILLYFQWRPRGKIDGNKKCPHASINCLGFRV
jgi:hypothetical protein